MIIGPLGHGVGVCEGIAKSVKILCDALGIWCMIALCGNNPEKGIKYRHTWNIVKIGKTCYHLDATFDNSLGKCVETGGGDQRLMVAEDRLIVQIEVVVADLTAGLNAFSMAVVEE